MKRVKGRGHKVKVEDLCCALDRLIAWATDIKMVLCSAKPGSVITVGHPDRPGDPSGPPGYYDNCPPPEPEPPRSRRKRPRKKAPSRKKAVRRKAA